MKPDAIAALIVVILGTGVGAIIGVGIGEGIGIRAMHREAVKAGVAEYVATPEGEVEFKWKVQE